MDVGWLRNGHDIPDSEEFRYVAKGNIHQLEIAEIFPEDSGKYTCEALNDHGEADSSAVINVLGKLSSAHPTPSGNAFQMNNEHKFWDEHFLYINGSETILEGSKVNLPHKLWIHVSNGIIFRLILYSCVGDLDHKTIMSSVEGVWILSGTAQFIFTVKNPFGCQFLCQVTKNS